MKTALLIDDDAIFRKVSGKWLRDAGWNTLEADDGEKGISMALEHRPDLVVCDLLMPRCNGFHVCRALRQNREVLPSTKIIVTTSSIYGVDQINALEAGADAYLVKPIKPSEFLNSIERLFLKGGDTTAFLRGHKVGAPSTRGPAPSAVTEADRTLVRFWGVRGSIPTPGSATAYYGGNTSCVEVRAEGQLIILDAGSGIRPLGVALGAEFKDRPLHCTLLISHTHWDHIQGFPFFAPAYNPRNSVRILGYEGSSAGLQATLSGQMESPYFPVGWKQLPSNISIEELKEMQFTLGPVQVKTSFLNHPGICVGYRIISRHGSVAYLPDNEPFQHRSNNGTEMLQHVRREEERLTEFIRGVDVLIIDSQYDSAEYSSHVGWGHGCIEDVVSLALEAKVKQLYLFHHDPSHDDEFISKMVLKARAIAQQKKSRILIDAAREGLEINFPVTQL